MNDNEGRTVLQYINKKQFSLETQKDLIFHILSREYTRNILNAVGEFRARVYTPLKVIHMGIAQALSADKSSANAISGINVGRLIQEKSPVCSNTGSYTKAKERLCEDTPYALVKSIGHCTLEIVAWVQRSVTQDLWQFIPYTYYAALIWATISGWRFVKWLSHFTLRAKCCFAMILHLNGDIVRIQRQHYVHRG